MTRQRVLHIKTSDGKQHPKTVEAYEQRVLEVFQENRKDLDACKQHVAVNHRRGIYVTVEVTLSATGEATNSKLKTQDSLRDARLIKCVENAVLAWSYPFHPKNTESVQTLTINIKR